MSLIYSLKVAQPFVKIKVGRKKKRNLQLESKICFHGQGGKKSAELTSYGNIWDDVKKQPEAIPPGPYGNEFLFLGNAVTGSLTSIQRRGCSSKTIVINRDL